MSAEAILNGSEPHLKFIWAAYRTGAFNEMPAGLSREEFIERIAAHVMAIQNVLLAISREPFKGSEEKPLGICIAGERLNVIEPHMEWFPWATARNRLEASVAFLDDVRKNGKTALVTTTVGGEAERFHNRICRYGVERFVGRIKGYFIDGTDANLYQTRPVDGR